MSWTRAREGLRGVSAVACALAAVVACGKTLSAVDDAPDASADASPMTDSATTLDGAIDGGLWPSCVPDMSELCVVATEMHPISAVAAFDGGVAWVTPKVAIVTTDDNGGGRREIAMNEPVKHFVEASGRIYFSVGAPPTKVQSLLLSNLMVPEEKSFSKEVFGLANLAGEAWAAHSPADGGPGTVAAPASPEVSQTFSVSSNGTGLALGAFRGPGGNKLYTVLSSGMVQTTTPAGTNKVIDAGTGLVGHIALTAQGAYYVAVAPVDGPVIRRYSEILNEPPKVETFLPLSSPLRGLVAGEDVLFIAGDFVNPPGSVLEIRTDPDITPRKAGVLAPPGMGASAIAIAPGGHFVFFAATTGGVSRLMRVSR